MVTLRAVILSEAPYGLLRGEAKNLALLAHGKLREAPRSVHEKAGRDPSLALRM